MNREHKVRDYTLDDIDGIIFSSYEGAEVVKRIHEAHPELLGRQIAEYMKWRQYGRYARKSVAQGLRDIGYHAKFIKGTNWEPGMHRIEMSKYPLDSGKPYEIVEIFWGGGEY